MSTENQTALDVTCPRCGFKAGLECRVLTTEGATSKIREPHQERIELAEEMDA